MLFCPNIRVLTYIAITCSHASCPTKSQASAGFVSHFALECSGPDLAALSFRVCLGTGLLCCLQSSDPFPFAPSFAAVCFLSLSASVMKSQQSSHCLTWTVDTGKQSTGLTCLSCTTVIFQLITAAKCRRGKSGECCSAPVSERHVCRCVCRVHTMMMESHKSQWTSVTSCQDCFHPLRCAVQLAMQLQPEPQSLLSSHALAMSLYNLCRPVVLCTETNYAALHELAHLLHASLLSFLVRQGGILCCKSSSDYVCQAPWIPMLLHIVMSVWLLPILRVHTVAGAATVLVRLLTADTTCTVHMT